MIIIIHGHNQWIVFNKDHFKHEPSVQKEYFKLYELNEHILLMTTQRNICRDIPYIS